MITCWEWADLLALICVVLSCVFVTFSYGVSWCQVWFLIVSIADLSLILYFYCNNVISKFVSSTRIHLKYVRNRLCVKMPYLHYHPNKNPLIGSVVQALISVQALVFDLAQLTCQKRFDCRNAILRSSAILLGTSYSQIVVAVLL